MAGQLILTSVGYAYSIVSGIWEEVCTVTHPHNHKHTHTITHTPTLSHTHTITHPHSHTHTHYHPHPHSHTHTQLSHPHYHIHEGGGGEEGRRREEKRTSRKMIKVKAKDWSKIWPYRQLETRHYRMIQSVFTHVNTHVNTKAEENMKRCSPPAPSTSSVMQERRHLARHFDTACRTQCQHEPLTVIS